MAYASEKKGAIILNTPVIDPNKVYEYRAVYVPAKSGNYRTDSKNPLDGGVHIEYKLNNEWSGVPSGWFLGTLLENPHDIFWIDGGQNWFVTGQMEILEELKNMFDIN